MHAELLTLALRPFIDPLPLQRHWWLLIVPVCLLVSISYKAVRVTEFKNYWKQVLAMTAQLIIAIVGVCIAAFLLVQFIIPRIMPIA
ncbi:MAG: hypothetical protein IT434_06535 [Phycisphaerales bacterium]|jgi:membrane protein YdbS with pleckstrin-like domain|nr:hypothetical protein [Phycisphaerales bacterium]